jgi:iron complex outermembrane receptor protein
MRRLLHIGVALALTTLPVAAVAQETGTIEGTVTLEDGTPVGAVTVVVTGTDLVAVTDPNGVFGIAQVPAGTHSLGFTLGDDFDTLEGVTVTAGSLTRADHSVPWDLSFAETITVYSASRRQERIVDAPAAVSIVTQKEIEREASHGQAPKLIEFTPGAEVTQSGIYDFNINTRGFNSSLNRRVATLVDGRDPSVPFLGAQEWAALSFPLDDLASVEMVRGPSAALYGANASSGVLNMITKRPKDYEGGLIRLSGGELSTFNADLRWAGGFGNGWYYKVLGGIRDHDDWFVSRRGAAEYATPCPVPQGTATGCLPQERVDPDPESDEINFYSLRIDKYLGNGFATLEGGDANVEGPMFQTGIGRVQLVDVSRPWLRANYFHPRWNLLAYYTGRDAPKQTSMASGGNLTLDTENVMIEGQANWELGDDMRLVAGASWSSDDIDSEDPATGRQTLVFAPVEADYTAFFAQLDWNLAEDWRLVLAGRYDDGDLFDGQFSPKAALVWSVNPKNTLRLTYNEAFQVANYSEFFLQANAAPPADLSQLNALVCLAQGFDCGLGLTPILALGNKDLELEEIQTIELGWTGILGRSTMITADAYFSENSNFITDLLPQLGTALGRINPNFGPWEAPAGVPSAVEPVIRSLVPLLSNNVDGSNILAAVSYTNFGDVDTSGFDLGLSSQFADHWTVNFTYSFFDFDVQMELPGFENLLVPNTPEHKVAGGLAFVTGRWNASISGRWVDEFDWAVGPFVGPVESYTTFDLAGEYGLTEAIDLGVVVTNMFDEEHYQSFGGDLIGRRALGTITFGW